jgi:DNA (cytosine-5)-methyltransferase 1
MRGYTFIDLFCGAGGLAEGFRQAGLASVFGVDSDKTAAATYQANFGHLVFASAIEKLRRIPVHADVVIGGPPCQGFSALGRMSPTDRHVELNALWRHFLRVVKQVRPLGFVIENVPEFLKSAEFKLFQNRIDRLGYEIDYGVLNAAEFGVPQKRRRGFIMGALGVKPHLPKPNAERTTVRDAIGDLPLWPDGKNLHFARNPTPKSIERYKWIPPGGNRFDLMRSRRDLTPKCWLNKPTGSTDVFGRLEWDKCALTIRTEFFKPEKGRYLHPKAHRPITHREAARLQTFPDTFHFVGSKIEIARQIGNAVPPKLAKAVAEALCNVLPQTEERRLESALERLLERDPAQKAN